MSWENYTFGGTWSSGGGSSFFNSTADAFQAGTVYMDSYASWGTHGFVMYYGCWKRRFTSGQSRRLDMSTGRKDFVVMGKWCRDEAGKATVINDISAIMVLVDLRGRRVGLNPIERRMKSFWGVCLLCV